MSDIWLAIAAEERTAPSSSSFYLSGRAAARAIRPRPWVQSQTRVKPQGPSPTTSKPRSPSEPSTVIFVGGPAARPQPAARSSTRIKSQAPLTTQAPKSPTPSEPSTAILVGGLAARPRPAAQSSTRVKPQAPTTTQASKPRTTSASTGKSCPDCRPHLYLLTNYLQLHPSLSVDLPRGLSPLLSPRPGSSHRPLQPHRRRSLAPPPLRLVSRVQTVDRINTY